MGFIAAGLAVAAVGAGVSAYGTAQNAAAMRKANRSASAEEDALYARQSATLDKLISQKNKKLHNLGNIFDRFESTGVFGDTDTLQNLRKAQEDFSSLAAGDFTGFESQLRKSMSDALISTTGSGSPVGSYAQLAADTQMNYRKEGIQTSVGISDFLSNEANKLLGSEFGIMDQKFQSQYELDRTTTSNKANYGLGAAATEGVGMSAYGGALSQIGSSIAGAGMYFDNKNTQQKSFDASQVNADRMYELSKRRLGDPYVPPVYNGPALPRSSGSVGTPSAPDGGFETTLPGEPMMKTYYPFNWDESNYQWNGNGPWQPTNYIPNPQNYVPAYDPMVLPQIGEVSATASLSNLGRRITMA